MEGNENIANAGIPEGVAKIPAKKPESNLRFVAIAAFFVLAIMAGYVVANPNSVSGFIGVSNGLGCHAAVAGAAAPIVANTAQAQASPISALENNSAAPTPQVSPSSGEVQEIKMDVLNSGWSPNSFVIKKGVKVRWIINGKELTGCNNEILVRDYNIDVKLHSGENVIEFTPTSAGTVRFSCWMGMIQGNFIVVDDPANQTAVSQATANAPAPKSSGGCGCGR